MGIDSKVIIKEKVKVSNSKINLKAKIIVKMTLRLRGGRNEET